MTSARPPFDGFPRCIAVPPLLRPKAFGVFVLASMLSVLQACSTPPKPVPPLPAITQIRARVEVSAQLNPSIHERASPLVLRIYELKTPTAFNSADFVSLFEHDEAQLGTELVAKDELMLIPGQSRLYAKTLGADTRFIGVFGAFRDVEHAHWRSVFAIEPGRLQIVLIGAGARDLDAHVVR